MQSDWISNAAEEIENLPFLVVISNNSPDHNPAKVIADVISRHFVRAFGGGPSLQESMDSSYSGTDSGRGDGSSSS